MPATKLSREEITKRRHDKALKAVELRVGGWSFKRVGRALGVNEDRAQKLCAQGVRLLRRHAKELKP